MIDEIIREGRNLTDSDIELLTLDSVDAINAAIDSALFPESQRAVGDRAYIRAFGRYLFVARKQRRENFPWLDPDEAESGAIQQAHAMLLSYANMTGPRTVAGFNGLAKKTARRALFKLERKINSYREDGEYTDETKGVRRVLAGSETTNDIDAFDLAEAFVVFYEKLTPDDQRILTPLYSVAGEAWAYYTPNVRDDVAKVELNERLNTLSDRWCVHPRDIEIRMEKLYDQFQDWLQHGDEVFEHYNHGPKWAVSRSAAGPDKQSAENQHDGVNGVRHKGNRRDPSCPCTNPRTTRARRRDHAPWHRANDPTRNTGTAVRAKR